MSEDFSHDQDASQGFFKFYFTTKGRASLRQFWTYQIVCLGIIPICFVLGYRLLIHPNVLVLLLIPYIIFMGLTSSSIYIKRCHDLGVAVFPWDKEGKIFISNSINPMDTYQNSMLFWRVLTEKGTGRTNKFGPPPK